MQRVKSWTGREPPSPQQQEKIIKSDNDVGFGPKSGSAGKEE